MRSETHRAALLLTVLVGLFCGAALLAACDVPNLEKPECSQARDAVKRFYSFHFGNDMHPTADNLKLRERYLTPELFKTLTASGDATVDYFTATSDSPKAFRLGVCTSGSPENASIQVILFWRDDSRSMQKEVKAEAVKTGDKWLINKVSN